MDTSTAILNKSCQLDELVDEYSDLAFRQDVAEFLLRNPPEDRKPVKRKPQFIKNRTVDNDTWLRRYYCYLRSNQFLFL